jgi:apolipoprotein N-acyltransferase
VNYLLAVSTGVLLILIFPRFGLTWLAPFALTPLLIACARETRWKLRFLQGWAGGFVFWFGVCYWIQFVLEVHGGLGRWGGWASFALFAVLKGLHMAVFATLAGFLMPRSSNQMSPWAMPAVAALWAGLERTHGELGFTWLQLGNAGVDMDIAMRLAPYTGVYGLSFLFALLACALALVALRRPRVELSWLALLLVLPFLPSLPPPAEGTEAVLVVQPNIDSEAQFTAESVAELERNLAVLSRAPGTALPGAGLIVWPEAPAPFYLASEMFRAYMGGIARAAHEYFLLGALGQAADGAPLNSAVMVTPDGTLEDRYDKMYLVPFGEFVPPVFGWVNRISHEAGDFEPGKRVVTFPMVGPNGDGHTVGAFICYESAFPDLVRQFTHAGAQVLINISNDGYFGTSAAREQHLSLVRMRAAENRRWILRATNDGITAVVDPAGRVTERLPILRQMSATMRVSYETALTPYVRFGDWFSWSCLAIGVLGALAGMRHIRSGGTGSRS